MVQRANNKTTSSTRTKCTKCKKTKVNSTAFYKTNSPLFPEGIITVCKECIKARLDYGDIETIYSTLRMMDAPFIEEYWRASELKKGDTFGSYLSMISLPQYKELRWKNSTFKNDAIQIEKETGVIKAKMAINSEERERLIDKWGFGYSDEELYQFEKKYNMLKDNYPERTSLHTESLLTYIRYRVKEELATARGDVGEADKWSKMADKASERAKINPNQLTQSDLSGGLSSFSDISRAVEKANNALDIAPRFMSKPQDKVDFTLECYVNYIRRLKNLPDVEYKDIWNFYNERKEAYIKNDTEGFYGEENEL